MLWPRCLDGFSRQRWNPIGLLGSTGTYAYLTRSEMRRTIEAAVECIGGRILIIVGVGALRTDDAQDLARDAQEAGADGLLLAPVSYTPLTDEEVFQHFSVVAATTDLPLCIYNNPSTTHFIFSDELVARPAALPRIIAVKNPAPTPSEAKAKVDALRRKLPADFAEVRRIDATLQPLWDLFKQHGSLRVAYAAANLLGLTDAQPPRPILPLGATERERVAQALDRLGI